jgi:hypothetical protein
MLNNSFDSKFGFNKLNLQWILEIASKFETNGKSEKAKLWFSYAERYENLTKQFRALEAKHSTVR